MKLIITTILFSLLAITVFQIAEDRELKRIDLQEKSWQQQGYNTNTTK